ncbi:MAG: DUF4350 domain-containing protein [Acidimicrobiales bacterium]
MNRRAVLFWVALAGVLLLVGALTGGRTGSGDPLDPDSTEPLGTHALMAFIAELGGGVDRGLPDDRHATTLVLADRLQPEQRRRLEAWIDGGGTVVVADPASGLAPTGDPGFDPGIIDDSGALASGRCDVEGLDGLTLEAGSFLLLDTAGVDASCFTVGDRAYVTVEGRGSGRVVALGGALPFTNDRLDAAENAVLASELLLGDGTRPVAVLYEPIVTPGSRSLDQLIPSAATWAGGQLLVALALFVAYRARRFGRPVPEPQPVALPGSLLVRAAAELQRRSRGHQRAGDRLRVDLERRLRRHLGVAPELPLDQVVAAAGDELAVDPVVVGRAVGARPIPDGKTLAAVVADVDAVNLALAAIPSQPRPVGGST